MAPAVGAGGAHRAAIGRRTPDARARAAVGRRAGRRSCDYGTRTQWIRNLQAAGGGAVVRAGRRGRSRGRGSCASRAAAPALARFAVRRGCPRARARARSAGRSSRPRPARAMPGRRCGHGTGSPATSLIGTCPAQTVELGVLALAVVGAAGGDLGRGLVERQREHRRRLELLAGRLARLRPSGRAAPARRTPPARASFSSGSVTGARLAEHHDRAVVDAHLEHRAREHDAVEQRDGEADGDARRRARAASGWPTSRARRPPRRGARAAWGSRTAGPRGRSRRAPRAPRRGWP